MSDPTTNGRRHWRSLEDLAQTPEFVEGMQREFPAAADELQLDPVDRRGFLGVMSASLALAGVSLSGCVRKPKQQILPYTQRPEDLIPGNARYFATAVHSRQQVVGVLVESQDGRPTKVEGNPRHPGSGGATDAWVQASILSLYDSTRAQKPTLEGKPVTYEEGQQRLDALAEDLVNKQGRGFGLLIDDRPSPTFWQLLAELRHKLPQARIYRDDVARSAEMDRALDALQTPSVRPVFQLQQAKSILAIDSDFLCTEDQAIGHASAFAKGRRLDQGGRGEMNRLYVVEPAFSVTGATADHRLQLPASKVGEFLRSVARQLLTLGAAADNANLRAVLTRAAAGTPLAAPPGVGAPDLEKWATVVAKDLMAHRGRGLILAGDRQPAAVHGLALLLNSVLGNIGNTVVFSDDSARPRAEPLSSLAADIKAKRITELVIVGPNPVYTAPADLGFSELLDSLNFSVQLSEARDETGQKVNLHLPRAHYLESWGDLLSADGTFSVQQPLIAPLHGARSEIETIAQLLGDRKPEGYAYVRRFWLSNLLKGANAESRWRRTLHDGLLAGKHDQGTNQIPDFHWEKLPPPVASKAAWPTTSALEVAFQMDWALFDGRYAGNAWLQEAPDPITKLTWDNAALIGPRTARALKLTNGDMVDLSLADNKLSTAVFVVPGVAANCVVMPLGYGRQLKTSVTEGVGFNGYTLRISGALGFAAGATIKKQRGKYRLASTQDYGSLRPAVERAPGLAPAGAGQARPFVREATADEYRKTPNFVDKSETIGADKLKSLWTEPNERGGQQWGMSIDLNSCTGCNACLVACQAENNIPVVGKERVLDGREMHWIRLDRYFAGEIDDPQVVVQPMPCQHCENAPCEQVCPVAATVHSPEGLNDMVYNRCIGTRYCSNNCPYKVRRFNFFNYQKENGATHPLLALRRNADVSVRFRGVMEKCTYCVQRIQEAKIASKRAGRDKVPDGDITPACAQTCPSEAIVFGDVNDPESRVSRIKRSDRSYAVLAELNNHPRTTYLAKLRNPNPELA